MTADRHAFGGLAARLRPLRLLAPLLISLCVTSTGSSMLTVAVSLKLSATRTDTWLVQLLLTGFPLGFMAGCLTIRAVIARLGHRNSFLAIALLAALAAGGYIATEALAAWLALRVVSGFSMASVFVVCESWINLYAGQHNRGAYFSLYMTMTSAAALSGQMLVALVGPQSGHLFPLAAATISAGFLICLLGGAWPALPARTSSAERDGAGSTPATKTPPGRFALWQVALLAPVTLVAAFEAGMTNMNVSSLTPLYGAGIGLPATTTVALITTFSVGGLLAQAPMGWMSDRFDRRAILIVQGALAALLCGAIIAVGRGGTAVLFLLFFAYGAVALTIYPVAIAFANARLDSHQMVAASGGLLLAYSLGNILTPGLATGLMHAVAPSGLFLLLGGGGLLVHLAALAAWRLRPRPAAPSASACSATVCSASGGSR